MRNGCDRDGVRWCRIRCDEWWWWINLALSPGASVIAVDGQDGAPRPVWCFFALTALAAGSVSNIHYILSSVSYIYRMLRIKQNQFFFCFMTVLIERNQKTPLFNSVFFFYIQVSVHPQVSSDRLKSRFRFRQFFLVRQQFLSRL